MIKLFLKAKHWQLFTLVFALPIALQVIMMVWMFSTLVNNPNPDPTFMFNYMKIVPFIMILVLGVNFGWSWSVAIGLQNKVPQNVTMKVKKFKIFFFIPLVYLSLITLFFAIFINTGYFASVSTVLGFGLWLLIVIIPLHFFAIFCMFYNMYFVSKTIKTVELQREVTFGEFIGEFFMIWFFFIGIWILQPKINKMSEEWVDNNNEFKTYQ